MTLTFEQEKEIVLSRLTYEGGNKNDRRPFYFTRYLTPDSAPSGWYQWTDDGLVYLGESILERA